MVTTLISLCIPYIGGKPVYPQSMKEGIKNIQNTTKATLREKEQKWNKEERGNKSKEY